LEGVLSMPFRTAVCDAVNSSKSKCSESFILIFMRVQL